MVRRYGQRVPKAKFADRSPASNKRFFLSAEPLTKNYRYEVLARGHMFKLLHLQLQQKQPTTFDIQYEQAVALAIAMQHTVSLGVQLTAHNCIRKTIRINT